MKNISNFLKFDKLLADPNFSYLYQHFQTHKHFFETFEYLDHFREKTHNSDILNIQDYPVVDLFLLGSVINTDNKLSLVFLDLSNFVNSYTIIPYNEFINQIYSFKNYINYKYYRVNDIYSDKELEELLVANINTKDEYLDSAIKYSKSLDKF